LNNKILEARAADSFFHLLAEQREEPQSAPEIHKRIQGTKTSSTKVIVFSFHITIVSSTAHIRFGSQNYAEPKKSKKNGLSQIYIFFGVYLPFLCLR
jgi:hypothetical protein